MSLASTKNSLSSALTRDDLRVVAISGKWGTGKTRMWEDLKASQTLSAPSFAFKDSLYVSVFGVTSIDTLKLKLFQNSARLLRNDRKKSAMVEDAIKAGGNFLRSLHKGFDAIADLALLAAPELLGGKLIVVDDIERKDDSLTIDALLGFIDEYSNQHSSRFLLILNVDKLTDVEKWNVLREKVIEQEIWLDTTPDECFEIAASTHPTIYGHHIKEALKKCGVTNIRVAQRIIRAVNTVLDGTQLNEQILARTVPSAVLLAAINYKGFDSCPTFEYVLENQMYETKKDNEDASDEALRASWKLLLMDLSIMGTDDYEQVVAEFLQTGILDSERIQSVLARYLAKHEKLEARAEFDSWLKAFFWDQGLSNEELLDNARTLLPQVVELDINTLQAFASNVTKIGGEELGEAAITVWLDRHGAALSPDIEHDVRYLGRSLHPKIQAVASRNEQEAQANTTLTEAIRHIREHRGWGLRQANVLKMASPTDFAALISSAGPDDLSLVLGKMVEFTAQGGYETHFGTATANFVEACRRIVGEGLHSRLGQIVFELFQNFGLEDRLAAASPQPLSDIQELPDV